MGRVITAPGVLTNVQGQIDHVTDMYDDIKNNNLKPLTITLDPVSNANGAVSVVTEDPRVTEDMKPISIEVGTPEVFKAPISVTTASGTVTLACENATGTSTVKVTLVKTSPVEGGADYPPAVTSTEFDILADRIGSLGELDTTDQSSIVNAVNEVIDDIGDINGDISIQTVTGSTSIASLVSQTPSNSIRKYYIGSSSNLSDYPSMMSEFTNVVMVTVDKGISSAAYVHIYADKPNGTAGEAFAYTTGQAFFWNGDVNSKISTNQTLTVTRTENAWVNAESIGRVHACKKSGYLFLQLNLAITNASNPPSDLTEIAKISGWNAGYGVDLTIAPQNGSNKVLLVSISANGGSIKIWGANGLDAVFYRTTVVVPEA